MFDETTDVSTIEKMVIHTRYVDTQGEVVTMFLKILDCLEGGEKVALTLNAETIAGKVTSYMDDKELDYKKLVGLGTDGAAVMVGKQSGAVKKILDKEVSKQPGTDNPYRALGQHCAAHKLNLAASRAGNSFPQIS